MTVRAVILAVILTAGGCAGHTGSVMTPVTYRHHQETVNLVFSWNADRRNDVLRLDGVVRNSNYQRLRDLVLTVTAVDEAGGTAGEGTFLFPTVLLDVGGTAPFDLAVPLVHGTVPTSVRFVTRFRYDERGSAEKLTSQGFAYRLP